MRDDVVHVASDPGPFVGGRLSHPQLTLALKLLGVMLQLTAQRALGLPVTAERPGDHDEVPPHRYPHRGDRVRYADSHLDRHQQHQRHRGLPAWAPVGHGVQRDRQPDVADREARPDGLHRRERGRGERQPGCPASDRKGQRPDDQGDDGRRGGPALVVTRLEILHRHLDDQQQHRERAVDRQVRQGPQPGRQPG